MLIFTLKYDDLNKEVIWFVYHAGSPLGVYDF